MTRLAVAFVAAAVLARRIYCGLRWSLGSGAK